MRLKTILSAISGFLFLFLGAIGMFIPVWPTTPFLLLAVGCFSSMPKIKRRIMKIPLFGEHIHNYQNKTGLSKKTVSITLGWLWGMLICSMFLYRNMLFCGLLTVVGVAVTFHILYMSKNRKTKNNNAD